MGAWLSSVAQNLFASAIAFTVGAIWAHRKWFRQVEGWIGGVHDRLDLAGVPNVGDQAGKHSSDGETGVMGAVPDGR